RECKSLPRKSVHPPDWDPARADKCTLPRRGRSGNNGLEGWAPGTPPSADRLARGNPHGDHVALNRWGSSSNASPVKTDQKVGALVDAFQRRTSDAVVVLSVFLNPATGLFESRRR